MGEITSNIKKTITNC